MAIHGSDKAEGAPEPLRPFDSVAVLPALVLTAGLGTRLDPLTRLVAKAAVPLGGPDARRARPRLAAPRRASPTSCSTCTTGPRRSRRVVGDGAHLGLRVRYSWEQPILGSAGGPRHALPLLDVGHVPHRQRRHALRRRARADDRGARGDRRGRDDGASCPIRRRDHYNGIAAGRRRPRDGVRARAVTRRRGTLALHRRPGRRRRRCSRRCRTACRPRPSHGIYRERWRARRRAACADAA